jgi:3-dehydroquinate synthase
VRLELPGGFPTEVHLIDDPDPGLLPTGRWVLMADEALRDAWTGSGLPVPEGSRFVQLGEETKTFETLLPWLRDWAALPLHRDATIVALGGGILTDMAGFAAAMYLRGIRWHAWPTTLLAQVDAGLGGKTGVNLPEGKNLVGAFHAPERFVACRSLLASLPGRHLRAGRWEVVKLALLEGDGDWALKLLTVELPDSVSLERALRMKAEITHRDPFEKGERRLLNLGHTLGHALESASGFALLHGEAVGLGLLAACFLSESANHPPFPDTVLKAMAEALRPLASLVPSWEACIPSLSRDKKAFHGGGEIHCILPLPGRRALQKPLPITAWADAHARLLRALN